MNPLQAQDLAKQRHSIDLADAAAGRDASGRPLRPTLASRLGRTRAGAFLLVRSSR